MKQQFQYSLIWCLLAAPSNLFGQHAAQNAGAAVESKEVKAEQQSAAEWAENALKDLSQIDQLILLNATHQILQDYTESPLHLKHRPGHRNTYVKHNLNALYPIIHNQGLKKVIEDLEKTLVTARELNEVNHQKMKAAPKPTTEEMTANMTTVIEQYRNLFQSYYEQVKAKVTIPKHQQLDLYKVKLLS